MNLFSCFVRQTDTIYLRVCSFSKHSEVLVILGVGGQDACSHEVLNPLVASFSIPREEQGSRPTGEEHEKVLLSFFELSHTIFSECSKFQPNRT